METSVSSNSSRELLSLALQHGDDVVRVVRILENGSGKLSKKFSQINNLLKYLALTEEEGKSPEILIFFVLDTGGVYLVYSDATNFGLLTERGIDSLLK